MVLPICNKGCLSLNQEGNAVEVRNGENTERRYELPEKDKMRLSYPLTKDVQNFRRIPEPQNGLWGGKSSFSATMPKSWINDADGSILNISLDRGEASLSGVKSEKILPEKLLLSSALFAKSDAYFSFCNSEGPSSMSVDMQRLDETGAAKVRLHYKGSETEYIGSFKPTSTSGAATIPTPVVSNSAPVPDPVTFSGRWVVDPIATRTLLKERGIITDDPAETKDLLMRRGFGDVDDSEEYLQSLTEGDWWQFDFSKLTVTECSFAFDMLPTVPFTVEAKPGQLRMVYTSKLRGKTTSTFDIKDENTVELSFEVEDAYGYEYRYVPLILVRDIQQNYSGEWKLRDVDALIQELSTVVDREKLAEARQSLQEIRLILRFNNRHTGSMDWKLLSGFPNLHNGRCRVVPVERNGRKLIFSGGKDSYGLGGSVTLIFDGPDHIRYTPMWGFTSADFVRVKPSH